MYGRIKENIDKVTPVKRPRLTHMMDFFVYASQNLVNQSVIAMNSDIGRNPVYVTTAICPLW